MNTSTIVNIEIFNIGLLSIAGTLVPHMEYRLPAMLRLFLSEKPVADILCFTEVHEREHRSLLIDAFSCTHAYATFFDDRMGQRKNNGLLLLSRFPLSEPGFISCANTAARSPTYCGRGVLFAKVHLSDEKQFRLLLTSLVSDNFGISTHKGEHENVLGEQLETVLDIASTGIRSHVIVGGFNCSPHLSEALCQHLFDSGYIDVFSTMNTKTPPEALQSTWDPNNPLNVRSPYCKRLARRIDHAFVSMSSGISISQAAIARTRACVPTPDGLMPLSDHYSLQFQLLV